VFTNKLHTILFYGVLVFLALVVSFFVVIPVASMVFSVTVSVLVATLLDSEVLDSLLLTFECALYATMFAILCAVPLAYLITFKHFPLKRFFVSLLDIPIVIPHTASGIALLFIFGSGFVHQLFTTFNISFIGSKAGITAAMTFVSVPYFINSVQNGFSSVDTRMINVARSLGASPLQSFITIILPLSLRAIVTGGLMMWGRAISEFGAVIIIAYHPMIAPVLLYDRFTAYGLSGSRPIAALLIVFCIIFFVTVRIMLSIWEKHAGTE